MDTRTSWCLSRSYPLWYVTLRCSPRARSTLTISQASTLRSQQVYNRPRTRHSEASKTCLGSVSGSQWPLSQSYYSSGDSTSTSTSSTFSLLLSWCLRRAVRYVAERPLPKRLLSVELLLVPEVLDCILRKNTASHKHMGCMLMIPSALSYISVFSTDKELPLYNALIGLSWGIGAILGPVVGGALSDSDATWRWVSVIPRGF